MSESASVDDIAILGMNEHAADVFGVGEAHQVPVVAAVAGAVKTGADRDAVAHPAFPGADPDGLRVRGIDSDGADGLGWLFVKDGLEGGTAVERFPYTTAGCADVNGEALAFVYGSNVGDASAHHRGTDGAGLESAEGVGINGHSLRRRRKGGEAQDDDDAEGDKSRTTVQHV